MKSYVLTFHPAVRKDLRKLSKNISQKIVTDILPLLGKNPEKGILLRGKMKGLRKYPFHLEGVSYRIVYEIKRSSNSLWVLSIGSRSEFYDRLTRRLK